MQIMCCPLPMHIKVVGQFIRVSVGFRDVFGPVRGLEMSLGQ